jgi:hypothetical protein
MSTSLEILQNSLNSAIGTYFYVVEYFGANSPQAASSLANVNAIQKQVDETYQFVQEAERRAAQQEAARVAAQQEAAPTTSTAPTTTAPTTTAPTTTAPTTTAPTTTAPTTTAPTTSTSTAPTTTAPTTGLSGAATYYNYGTPTSSTPTSSTGGTYQSIYNPATGQTESVFVPNSSTAPTTGGTYQSIYNPATGQTESVFVPNSSTAPTTTAPTTTAPTTSTATGISGAATYYGYDPATLSEKMRAALNSIAPISLSNLRSPATESTPSALSGYLLTVQKNLGLTDQELIDAAVRTIGATPAEIQNILNNKNNYTLVNTQTGEERYIPKTTLDEFLATKASYANLLANAPYGRDPVTGMPYTKDEANKQTQLAAIKSGFEVTRTKDPATSINIGQNALNAFKAVMDRIESNSLSASEAVGVLTDPRTGKPMTLEAFAGYARYYAKTPAEYDQINRVFGKDESGNWRGAQSTNPYTGAVLYSPPSTTPTSTAPTSTAPTSTVPTSTIIRPTSTAPTSTAPTSTAPTSTAPTSTAPTSTAPTSTVPTSTIIRPTSTAPTSTAPTSTTPTSTTPTSTTPTSTTPTSTTPTSTTPTSTTVRPTSTAPTSTAPTTSIPVLPLPPAPTTPTPTSTVGSFQSLYKSPNILQPTRGMSALLAEANKTPTLDFMGYNPQTLINTAQEFVYQDKNLTPQALDTYLKDTFKLTSPESNYILSNLNFAARPASITAPSLTYDTQGFTAPSQSGLTTALANPAKYPGGANDFYKAIANHIYDPFANLGPEGVAKTMAESGVTTDDIIRATGLFPRSTTAATTPVVTTPVVTTPVVDGGGGGVRSGGPISFAEGGETKYIDPVPANEIINTLLPKSPANIETIVDGLTSPIANRPLTYKSEVANPLDAAPAVAMKKYGLSDFGIQQPATTVFPYQKDVLYGPELGKLEAAALASMTPKEKEQALQKLMIRQGRTGLEYFPANFKFNFAEGGDVGRGLGSIAMKGYAQEMAQKGRFGDTMLAHISPEEAQMLQAAGGAGTINPQTGLPEYFSWKKLLKGLGKVLPFVLPFTGIGLGAQALISGLSGAVSGGKGFDFKRGLMSGLMSYGMGSLAQGAGAAANAPTPDITVPQIDTSMNPAFADQAANVVGSGAAPAVNTFKSIADVPLAQMPGQFLENIQAVGQGAMGAATGAPGAREAFTAGQGSVFGKQLTPTVAAGAAAVGTGGVEAADEMNQLELQLAIANAKTEEERQYYINLASRLLPNFAIGGGISALVAGGATGPANAPRTINGAGDGMSDSVPATIEGVQEARLADGEFVIPADVVADLGNGSSNAGSKKLYAMMDRIRNARHGTTEQPPEVNMGRLMPA